MKLTRRSLLDAVYLLEDRLLQLKRELNTSSPAIPCLWELSRHCEISLNAICFGIQGLYLEIKMEDTQTTPSTTSGETPASEQGKP